MKINFPKGTEQYAQLQCNSKYSDYTECPEFSPFEALFSSIKPKRILELGAGLGRASVFLKNTYSWEDTEFHLLDGDSGTEQIAGIHAELETSFYNSMTATRTFCTANGIQESNLFLLNAEQSIQLPDRYFDLCYSVKSIGFHWPINSYLKILSSKMVSGGLLLFELRNAQRYPTQRIPRISKFVEFQLAAVDYKVYKLVQFEASSFFPVLVLKKW
jgi:SAM-dependent methyltransferase